MDGKFSKMFGINKLTKEFPNKLKVEAKTTSKIKWRIFKLPCGIYRSHLDGGIRCLLVYFACDVNNLLIIHLVKRQR